MNTSVKQKTKRVFILRNTAGKIAMFFAQRVEAIKSIEFLTKSTDVSVVAIGFMTLLADIVAGYFVQTVIVIAVITLIVWVWMDPEPDYHCGGHEPQLRFCGR